MTLTLQLSAEQEARLRENAEREGYDDPADYVKKLIDSDAPRLPASGGAIETGTGEELVAALKALNLAAEYGDPSIDSVDLARQLRDDAEKRSWQSRQS